MKKVFPILAVLTAFFLAYAFYQAMFVAPTDALQGDVYRIIYYHVPSAWTAFLLFFINFIASVHYLANAKPSTQRATRWIVIALGIAGLVAPFIPQVRQQLPLGMYPSSVATTALILGFLHHRSDHRPHLGTTGVGHLVGPGRHSPHFDAGVVADLCELSCAAAILGQRADPEAGRCPCGLWCARRPARLFFHLVFPHATSSACDRRWRLDGPADVTRAADQLDGDSVFRVSGLLVTIPAGKVVPRNRRS